MAIEINAAVRGHIREAVKYAAIVNQDADPTELTAHLLAEIGNHVDTIFRERAAGHVSLHQRRHAL